MKAIKVYVAGKVSPNSVFGKHDWRDGFCEELSKKSGIKIINLDPTKGDIDQNNSKLVVGRNNFLIKSADLVIVNLTDDISVGGSQEMLIAKYYKKPLVGLAQKGGKFNKSEKEMFGKVYKNYIDPYVNLCCDKVIESMSELANFIRNQTPVKKIKDLSFLDEALAYYGRGSR